MIHESEVYQLLGAILPTIGKELEKPEHSKNIYTTVQCFAHFTRSLIGAGNLQTAKLCLNLAEELVQKGNNTVKNAIENVFLYTLSPLLDKGDACSASLKSMMGGELMKEYQRQLATGGL